LEIGCPVPLSPHHVTIIASITDRSMNLGRQATPSTNLDGSPPMTEGVQSLISRSTLRAFRAEAAAHWQAAVTAG
jgi:hypothetical protein